MRRREEAATRDILNRADVVLVTLTSASPDSPLKLLDDNHFELVVIDECSQVAKCSCFGVDGVGGGDGGGWTCPCGDNHRYMCAVFFYLFIYFFFCFTAQAFKLSLSTNTRESLQHAIKVALHHQTVLLEPWPTDTSAAIP